MNSDFKKWTALFLAAALLFSASGCGVFSLTEADRTELQETEPISIVGQSIGEELAATYAADHVFSLNCVLDSSFNPYRTSSAWNRVVSMLVYELLVETDKSFEAQPNLLTAWETEDGQTWTFTVDTSRSFHDGGAMTAADAVYSIEQAMSSTQYTRRFSDVTGVYSEDQSTLVVTLRRPNWRFYELLDVPCVEYGYGYADKPPGTGPYKFASGGRYLRLDEEHPLASELPLRTIYLKEYGAAVDVLQAFEDSYIDLVINDPTGMSSLGYSSTNIIKYVDTTSLHYLGYNTRSGLFSQPMLRSIVTYAIDRATIVSEVMQGAATAATVPIHPQSGLYPADYAKTLAFSETGFQTALDNVGAVDLDLDGTLEFGGQRTTVDFIVCADSTAKVLAARTIANELSAFGIDVSLRELPYSDYVTALEKGNYDIYYAEVRLCADWDLAWILGSGEDLNYGGYNDSTLDGYMSALLASEPEHQAEAAEQLCQYIGQTAPITAICFEKSEVLYHRGVLSGLEPMQDNIFHNMQNWTADLS